MGSVSLSSLSIRDDRVVMAGTILRLRNQCLKYFDLDFPTIAKSAAST